MFGRLRARRSFGAELSAQTETMNRAHRAQQAELAELQGQWREDKVALRQAERASHALDLQLRALRGEIDRTKRDRLTSRATWEPHDWRDFD